MGFKKGSIGAILMEDLNRLKKERDVLIEELKDLYPNNDLFRFTSESIANYNIVIKELEHIINKAKQYKESK